ncbi:MAG: PilZ domain-containing protein, partial [Deltaproteobacteria bacterium]
LAQRTQQVAALQAELAALGKSGAQEATGDGGARSSVTELQAQLLEKEQQLKRALEEGSRFEEQYYQAKNDVDIARKECSELEARQRQNQRSKDDVTRLREELRQSKAAFDQQSVLQIKMKEEAARYQILLEEASRRTLELEERLWRLEEKHKGAAPAPAEPAAGSSAAPQTAPPPPPVAPAPLPPPEQPGVAGLPLKQHVRQALDKHDRRIGEILISHKFITKEELAKALDFQQQYGGNVTQYLLHFGYIDEKELAQCLSEQFKVPFLPLNAYTITDEAVAAIPVDIAEKYWVMPVEKMKNALVVAMIDPLDTTVVGELAEMAGMDIIPFVGLISDIVTAHQIYYYKTFSKEEALRIMRMPAFFIDTSSYKGAERRQTIRYAACIDIRFPMHGQYVDAQTIDVSRGGFAFVTDQVLQEETVMTIEILLPPHVSRLPISAVVQVIRCIEREKGKYQIGVKTLKIAKADTNLLVSYASTHQEPA